MMPIEVWLGFVGVALVFMATPGPSHLLMVSNTLSSGLSRSVATAVGDLTANAIQMLAAGLGVSALLATFPAATTGILIAGGCYIAWLGLEKLRSNHVADTLQALAPATRQQLWLQGFMTSMTNPKAIIFFAAFFPPFVRATYYVLDWLLLSITYVAIDGTFLLTYGLLANRLAAVISGRQRMHLERACGAGLLIVALVVIITAWR
ncbi:MAG: LysE family translocator [Pseudomonadota bacterium]